MILGFPYLRTSVCVRRSGDTFCDDAPPVHQLNSRRWCNCPSDEIGDSVCTTDLIGRHHRYWLPIGRGRHVTRRFSFSQRYCTQLSSRNEWVKYWLRRSVQVFHFAPILRRTDKLIPMIFWELPISLPRKCCQLHLH